MLRARKIQCGEGPAVVSPPPYSRVPVLTRSQPLLHPKWVLIQPVLTQFHHRETGIIFLLPFASVYLL